MKIEMLIILLLLIGIWYLSQLAVYLCAKLNFFWVIPREGEAVAIMRNGEFYKMLLRYTGHHFRGHLEGESEEADNLNIYEIETSPNAMASPSLGSRLLGIVFPIRGISWIGIPPFNTVYKYKFAWTDDKFVEREQEELRWILVQEYVYGIILPTTELEGGIPYAIKLLATMQVTNPAKALFRIKRWFDASTERLSGWARDEISTLSYGDFVAPTSDSTNQISPSNKLRDSISRILGSALDIRNEFGLFVKIIQVARIDPADEKLRDITIKKEVAKQTALASIEEAKGKAEANKIAAEGEATAIRIVNEAASKMSDKALILEGYRAIKDASATVTLIGKDLNLPAMINIPVAEKKGGSE